MKRLLNCIAACLLFACLQGCAEEGTRQALFGHWHETMVLFRDYQNNVLVATDSTEDQLYAWRFQRDGNGRRTLDEDVEKFKWTFDEATQQINLCTDQGLLSCILYAYTPTDADHIRLIARYNETATTYTEGEFRLERGK